MSQNELYHTRYKKGLVIKLETPADNFTRIHTGFKRFEVFPKGKIKTGQFIRFSEGRRIMWREVMFTFDIGDFTVASLGIA